MNIVLYNNTGAFWVDKNNTVRKKLRRHLGYRMYTVFIANYFKDTYTTKKVKNVEKKKNVGKNIFLFVPKAQKLNGWALEF
jgi:hypothetical protein